MMVVEVPSEDDKVILYRLVRVDALNVFNFQSDMDPVQYLCL